MQGTIEGEREQKNSDENISLLPHVVSEDDDGRMAGGIEVSYRKLDDDEIEAIQRNARDRIIEEEYRWGTKTYDIPVMKLAGTVCEPQITEYAYEEEEGFHPGTRTVVFEEQVELTSGDDGLLSIDIVTFEDSNEVETITINTTGGPTWVGHRRP
jgi:hypothetical protein